MEKRERLDWVDGLRGLACVLMFVHHWMTSFYPSTYNGEMKTSYMPYNLDVKWSAYPISFLTNGNFLLFIFCVVSGLVLSYQIYHMQDVKKIGGAILKRYPRLMLPLLAVSLIVWVMMQGSLFYGQEAFEITTSTWLTQTYLSKEEMTLAICFKDTLLTTWLAGSCTFNPVVWMMGSLLSGSLLSYLLALMTKGRKWPAIFVYVFMSFYCLTSTDYKRLLLFGFVCGSAIAYRIVHFKSTKAEIPVGVISLIAGAILGGYPSGAPAAGVYHTMWQMAAGRYEPVNMFYHVIGAALFVYGVYCVGICRKFFSMKWLKKLGDISYSVYLIHAPLICSWSSFIYVQVYRATGGHNKAGLVSLVTSLVLLIVLSWLFEKYIEKYITKGINFCERWLLKENS